MSFLIWLTSLFSIWTVQVEWINQILDVPLYDNIQNYKEIPEANLYIDNVLVIDPLMYYERDAVDHTFFSVITTSHVRTYTMRYRVYFPSYNVIHTQDIIFNIVDLVPPVIEHVGQFRIPLGNSMPDLEIGFIYLDNYDATENLYYDINDMEVVLNQTGIYPIYYQVSDLSGNTSYATTTIEIYDFIPPLITLNQPIIIDYQETWEWSDFITVRDNDDPYPYVLVNDFSVDYQTLGNYLITIYATDKNELTSQQTFELAIVDREPPLITVKSLPTPISVFSDESDIDFLSYVISVEDNYDNLQIIDLNYRHDIEFDVLGQYYIYYSLSDESGNEVELKMKINVVDDQKPVINIINPLIFDVDEHEPFFIDYIEYFDNYTSYDQLILKMTESVNMGIIGKYPLTIDVTDSSGNKTTLRTYIEIVDRIAPQIEQINDILITDFARKNLTYYFLATDNYDKESDLTIYVDDSLVDYEQIGVYQIHVSATDLSDNQSLITVDIIIIDIEEPVLVLKQNMITIEVFSPPLDILGFIIEATDNYDLIDREDVQITGEISYDKIGIYQILLSLEDSSKNLIIKSFYVKVDDLSAPIIQASEMTLQVGQFFDPYDGIKVIDNLDDIDLKWFPQYLDTSTPGEKTVNYIATDSRGNYTTYQRTVVVEPVSEEIEMTEYIPVGMISILGIAACLYFYKRMS